jgi:hypothetical protein
MKQPNRSMAHCFCLVRPVGRKSRNRLYVLLDRCAPSRPGPPGQTLASGSQGQSVGSAQAGPEDAFGRAANGSSGALRVQVSADLDKCAETSHTALGASDAHSDMVHDKNDNGPNTDRAAPSSSRRSACRLG